jgi:hypothetical protein
MTSGKRRFDAPLVDGTSGQAGGNRASQENTILGGIAEAESRQNRDIR